MDRGKKAMVDMVQGMADQQTAREAQPRTRPKKAPVNPRTSQTQSRKKRAEADAKMTGHQKVRRMADRRRADASKPRAKVGRSR